LAARREAPDEAQQAEDEWKWALDELQHELLHFGRKVAKTS
jgi:hypothetical protein